MADPYKPRITRQWFGRLGAFCWTVGARPEGKWGYPPKHEDTQRFRAAYLWCVGRNRKQLEAGNG
jgi:hypothetical protein